jgi:nucleoside-diphosphate-sugar epimerase
MLGGGDVVAESPKTAFITGGSGFIGGRLIRRLVSEGWSVRALARSPSAAEKVRDAGAEPVEGDLERIADMRSGAEGCSYAFHAAAHLGEWGSRAEFERINVGGTRNVLEACRGAGVDRLIHVGTEAALLAGRPLVNVNEDEPLRPDSKAPYAATKAMAEQAVRDANADGFETVVVRPRLVWGRGDTTVLPNLVRAIETGRFSWIGGGRHLTSTTHVDNTVHGLILGAERGKPGGVYFVTDGEPVVFRDFITELVGTQGVEVPDRNMPAPIAKFASGLCEAAWRALPLRGVPPVTRIAVWLSSLETTIDISRAEDDLGYEPVRTADEGMRELRESAATVVSAEGAVSA